MNRPNRVTFRRPINYWIAWATEILHPLLRAYAHSKSCRPVSTPEKWRKVLLVGNNHIGDILYRTASLPALKKGLPQCEFDFIAPPPADQVLERNPFLRKVHHFEMPTGPCSSNFETLQAENYDAVICYEIGTKVFWLSLLLAIRLGIPNRVAFSAKGFSGWITHPITFRPFQPLPGYFRDMVAELTNQPADWPLRPLTYPSPEHEAKAQSFWSELKLDPARHTLACFVTSRQPTGVFPEDKFLEVLRCIHSQNNVQIVLNGMASETGRLSELAAQLGPSIRINPGRLDLLSLACFLRHCTVTLSTDSGPRHLANAIGCPVVFVSNLWAIRKETGVYCKTEYDMAPPDECVPTALQAAAFEKVQLDAIASRVLQFLTNR